VRELEKKFSGKVSSDKSAAFVNWACRSWILCRIEMDFRYYMYDSAVVQVLKVHKLLQTIFEASCALLLVLECPSLLMWFIIEKLRPFCFLNYERYHLVAGCSAYCHKAYFEGSKEGNSS
jgi:hypothetical protein